MPEDGPSLAQDSDRRKELARVRQQRKRSNALTAETDATRSTNTTKRRIQRAALSSESAAAVRAKNTDARRDRRANTERVPVNELWWNTLPSSCSTRRIKLQWNRTCRVCGIKVLTGEKAHDLCFVCGPKGKHLMPVLPPYPVEWDPFMSSPQVGALSRKLNNLFTLTALGVDNGEFMKFESGISAVTLNGGRTYHRLIPSNEGEHAIRWFLFDPDYFLSHAPEQKLKPEWVTAALRGLERVNPFITELESLAQKGQMDDTLALHIQYPEAVSPSDIAAIVSIAPVGTPAPRSYVIRYKGEDEHRFLPNTSPLIEPLHYLLLLPHGTMGWGIGQRTANGDNFTQMRWYRTRFFMNAPQICKFSRLAGEYLVDAWSAVEESRLFYIRTHQHSNEDDEDGEFTGDGDTDPTGNIRLPSSFMHSPAWTAANVADCLALRRSLGTITLFSTFTCNPKWPEIVSELLPGQSAQDRPDVTIRVFKSRITAVHDVMHKLFGPELYHIKVTEFQKRSLPHEHHATALKFVPRTPADLDKFLSAEIPLQSGPLQDAVRAHMIHSHDPSRKYSRCGYPSKPCQYGYPKPLREESIFTERGIFEPRRRREEDRWVVLHSPHLLLAWDGHVNTEYGASSQLPVYLYKYFFKGPDETRFRVDSAKNIQQPASGTAKEPIDEIRNYERARYLSAMEAAWRLAGFNISAKHPGVTRLPIHLPGRQQSQMGRKDNAQSNATLLMRYLDRPRHPRLDNLTYIQFGEQCRMATHTANTALHELEVVEKILPGRPQMRIRFRDDRGVARMMMVYPRHGDVFYLRMILAHRAANSFSDARTVDGVTYGTFQEAARAMGLLDAHNECELAFLELLELGVTPGHLRWFFCVLAAEGNPVLELWSQHRGALSADFRDNRLRLNPVLDEDGMLNDLLMALQDILCSLGKRLRDVGLPEPVARTQAVEEELRTWNGDPDDLHSFATSLTVDQRNIYDRLLEVCCMEEPAPIHIDGRAGRGKTYCLYPVIGALRKQGKIVLISASSAFAAKNYPGGRTVHYMYGVPVDENNPVLESLVRHNTDRAALLLAATAHIIDEIGALHFKAFDCADRLMRMLTKSSKIWGGRLLITAGDFRQAAPVVRRGGRDAICSASLRTQPAFRQFEVLRLHEPLRQAGDPRFSDWLDSVGDDYEHEKLDLARLTHTTCVQEVLDFVYPAEIMADSAACMERAILSPFNEFVDDFNSRILDRLPGDPRTYFSTDSIEDDGGPLDMAQHPLATPDYLNAQDEPGIPPHELDLKVGAICRFIRNFSGGAQGITKNTRVIVTRLLKYSVEVRTLPTVIGTRHLPSMIVHVPRINFTFMPLRANYTIHRKQMPLVLSYAVTFNGCQGLTVKRLALDLRRTVFSHGQLYSAMTRVPAAADVRVLKEEGDDSTVTTNIVWKELLLQ